MGGFAHRREFRRHSMLFRSAVASTLLFASLASPAFAQTEQAATPFRSVEAQQFTAQDLQNFGLTGQETAHGMELQAKGYHLVALTPEEARAYQAGHITQNEWILIGIGVLIILAVT